MHPILHSIKKDPRRALKRTGEWVFDRAVRAGLKKGTSDYQRFVILGWYRTGSNFLVSALNSHPEAVAFSELFFGQRIFWANAVYGKAEDDPALTGKRDETPVRFLEEDVFRPYPKGVRAVGFKLFYTQIENEQFQGFYDHILGAEEFKFIHLKRRNFLDCLISGALSRQWGKVAVKEPEWKEGVPKVNISVDRCEKLFRNLEGYFEKYGALLPADRTLEVFYEDIARPDSPQMDAIRDFLGLSVRDLSPRVVKQNRFARHEVLENFEELKAHFQGTRWAWFFEDGSED